MTEEQKAQAAEVAAWLESYRCYDLKPALIHIQGAEFVAVEYKQDHEPLPGARSQEPYTVHAYYVLGHLPKSYQKSSRTVYRVEGDERDWYIAGYFLPRKDRPEWTEANPHGPWFRLDTWESEPAIDWHDIQTGKKPYARIAMEIAD